MLSAPDSASRVCGRSALLGAPGAAARPASHPGARPWVGGSALAGSIPLPASSHAVMELEFHISPVRSSSRPQVSAGSAGTRWSRRRAMVGSSLRRCGLSTASAMSGIRPLCQRRISYRDSGTSPRPAPRGRGGDRTTRRGIMTISAAVGDPEPRVRESARTARLRPAARGRRRRRNATVAQAAVFQWSWWWRAVPQSMYRGANGERGRIARRWVPSGRIL